MKQPALKLGGLCLGIVTFRGGHIPEMELTRLELSKNWNFAFNGARRPFLGLEVLWVVHRLETLPRAI